MVKTAQQGVAGATLTSASSQLPFVAQFYEPGPIGPIGQGYCSILFLVYIDAQEYWAHSWSQSISEAKKYYDNIFLFLHVPFHLVFKLQTTQFTFQLV